MKTPADQSVRYEQPLLWAVACDLAARLTVDPWPASTQARRVLRDGIRSLGPGDGARSSGPSVAFSAA